MHPGECASIGQVYFITHWSDRYLGGSLLAQLRNTALPGNETIYALVRSQEQAEAVKEYDVLPFTLDLQDEKSVTKNIVDAQIFVVYFLVDAVNCDMQIPLIKALGEVKRQTGREVHFLHTSGAKMFSEHAGMPTDRRLVDTDPALYDLQKSSESPHEFFTKVSRTQAASVILLSVPQSSHPNHDHSCKSRQRIRTSPSSKRPRNTVFAATFLFHVSCMAKVKALGTKSRSRLLRWSQLRRVLAPSMMSTRKTGCVQLEKYPGDDRHTNSLPRLGQYAILTITQSFM